MQWSSLHWPMRSLLWDSNLQWTFMILSITSANLKRPSIVAHTFSNVNPMSFHGYRIFQDLQALPFPIVCCMMAIAILVNWRGHGQGHEQQWQRQTVCRIWAQQLPQSNIRAPEQVAWHTQVAFVNPPSTAPCLSCLITLLALGNAHLLCSQ